MFHREFHYDPPTEALNYLYVDEDILVVAKPGGLLSVPGKPEDHKDCLEARVQREHPQARTVHRLDLGTSGVVVMAMNASAHRHLGLQFERRKTAKIYIARVAGHVAEDTGTIDLPLRCDWPNRPRQMVDHEKGKAALTHWRVIKREEGDVTRIELRPETGRSHQLRVHMMSLGHPILGDEFYAPDEVFEMAGRLQLHAFRLSLHHPANGQWMSFKDVCPF